MLGDNENLSSNVKATKSSSKMEDNRFYEIIVKKNDLISFVYQVPKQFQPTLSQRRHKQTLINFFTPLYDTEDMSVLWPT